MYFSQINGENVRIIGHVTILIFCKDSSFDLIDVVGKKQAEAAATKQAPSIILNGTISSYE